MKYITILLCLMSFVFAQERDWDLQRRYDPREVKIDSVAIRAEMAVEAKKWNDAEAMIVKLEASKLTYAYAYNVLAKMLVPKVEPVVEEGNNE